MIEIPNGWRDYVLLDAGDGEKLELWGKVKVIRPDPQAFWPQSYKWEKPDMHYHRSASGGGSWEYLSKNVPETWGVNYRGMKFKIRPTGFKHMGLFPEQAIGWRWIGEKVKNSTKTPRILNLFAYTGGATVAAIKNGADVTHVDASKGMNAWAKENIHLSGLSKSKHRVLTDDVLKFVQRECRRGNKYDGVIMDPPVFGRGPGGELWKLDEKLFDLVRACSDLLSHEPLFFAINAYTAGFSPYAFSNVLSLGLSKKLQGTTSVGEIGIEAKSGVVLPCGVYARWEP